jgi:hypothetical protein
MLIFNPGQWPLAGNKVELYLYVYLAKVI